MAAVAFTKFNCLALNLTKKIYDLSADTFMVMLTNTAPNAATNTVLTDITEIAAGNGYTAGGNQAAVGSDTQTGGVAKWILSNPAAWTAAGGSIGPFRYAVLYDSTPSSKPLMGYYDYGSAITLNAGEQFQVTFDQTNGVFTVT